MKKSQFAMVIGLVLVIFVGVGVFLFSNSFAVSDNDNEKIISEVAKLEKYAKDYIQSTGSSDSSTKLTLDYIRSLRYNDMLWNMLLGTPDAEFSAYVSSKGGIDIDKEAYFTDENTYKRTDFVHLIAVLDCYYKYGETVRAKVNPALPEVEISTDYSGWAGDLLTLMEEVYAYRTTNNITDEKKLLDYTRTLLGTNRASSFDTQDMYGDLDALNLYRGSEFDLSDLATSFKKYYVDASSKANYTNRVESSRAYIGNDEATIKANAAARIKNTLVQQYLIPTAAGKLSDLDYNVATQALADYILQKPYLEITSSKGSGVVGTDDLKVQLYESNLGVPIITMTKDICEVEIINDIMYIKPTNAGSTTITVSTFNKQASVTYELTATNVAPSITKQLDIEYTLSTGVESSISLVANGTNNTYTWYIADSTDGDFTKLGVTVIPTLKITPTMDMDGKYIKCIITNEGNPAVESNVAKINVRNVSLGDIVGTGDMTLILALSLIFLVVCANIFVYTVRKYKYNLF